MSACCPPDRVPALKESDNAKAVGTTEQWDGMDVYITGNTDKKRAVVVIPDVFGAKSGRHHTIADMLAEKGYYVVMPDVFRGDRLYMKDMGEDKTRLYEFLKLWVPGKWQPDMDKVWAHLAEKGIEKTACFGFCWGCWATFHESARGKPVACGVNCHPSLAIEGAQGNSVDALAEKAACPMLMVPCKGDPDFVQKDGSVHKILAAKDACKDSEYVPMTGQNHGFMSQGELSNEGTAEAIDTTTKAAIAFLAKHLA